jgi:N-methylhydantoinase A
VLCAYGDATTKERNEASRTFIRPFSGTTHKEVSAMLDELKTTAAATLDSEGVPRKDQTVVYQVDVRYHGQGLELPIVVDIDSFKKGGLDHIASLFDETHRRLFTFTLDVEKEIVNLRAIVQGKAPRVESGELGKGDADPSAARVGETTLHVRKTAVKAPVYARGKLLAGNMIAGPAIVTEMDSTTLILPDHVGEVHVSGNILIRPAAR